jgi:uncharacterized protein YbjT (DUF2867 family)
MILVVGAAGKTGRALTNALLRQGIRVRAAVRPGSSNSPVDDSLVTRAEVDLTTGEGLAAALDGVDGAYHLAPNVHPDEVGIARRVARAAASAGVARLVFHSVLHPDDASMPHHLRKGDAERVVRSLVPGATVLRPAAYHQNLLRAALDGRILVPYSLDSAFSNVDLDDVAEVAALVLTREGHEARAYDLAGPEALSVRELARQATAVLHRPVEAVELPLASWIAGADAALSDSARDDLVAMFRAYDRDGLVGDAGTLRGLLGREPTTWRALLERSTSPTAG